MSEKSEGNDRSVIASVEGGVEREFKGWEIQKEVHGKCRACDELLFTIVKVSDNPKIVAIGGGKAVEVSKQRFKANCPFCGDESWVLDGQGELLVGPHDKTVMVDMIMGNPLDSDGMLSELKLEKLNGS